MTGENSSTELVGIIGAFHKVVDDDSLGFHLNLRNGNQNLPHTLLRLRYLAVKLSGKLADTTLRANLWDDCGIPLHAI